MNNIKNMKNMKKHKNKRKRYLVRKYTKIYNNTLKKERTTNKVRIKR